MSAIDTVNHAHVGSFFGIPIYWVLEDSKLDYITDSPNDVGEIINKYYLSIGGGSGEHPALILNNDALVYQFLNNLKSFDEVTQEFDLKLIDLYEQIQNRSLIENGYVEYLHFWDIDQNQWPLETFIDIHEKFKNFHTRDSLSKKIKNAFALFIIYEMPLDYCLKDPQLLEIAKMIKSNLWSNIFEDNIFKYLDSFSGVLNSQKYGKIIRDDKVFWGYSLNDWIKEHNIVL